MNKNIKTAFLTLAFLSAVTPLVGIAFAQGSKVQSTQTQKMETTIRGSIALPADNGQMELTDAQETAQYQSLAKITAAQASAAAQAKVPGAVVSVKLEEQDGFLVYEVKIGTADVIVDAGNGQVLSTEMGDNETSDNETSDNETSD